jgi:hypothetical protein
LIKYSKAIFGISILTLLIIIAIILNKDPEYYNKRPGDISTVHPTYVDDSYFIPGYGKSFIGFKENLAYKESRGKYTTINTLGYMGKYQFGSNTLASLKIRDTAKFLNSPKIQEKAFRAHLSRNKWLLKSEIEKYSGKKIRGVIITESGILAAAHLAGVGSVKKFLQSNGKLRAKDAYGTRIEHYMRDFADYDLSFIDATPNPKL